jgi:uncharacterized membrane protein
MSNNVVIPLHAAGATIALLLGAYNLLRRARGDRTHRRVGRVWVVAMYWTIVSSFAVKALTPGHFSWIHGLSVFTFITLTIGLWAAVTHRVRLHSQFMTGSYLGLVGAFLGAVAVPFRDIPQWIVHRPVPLALAALGCALVSVAVVGVARREAANTAPRPGGHRPRSGLR